MRAARAVGEKVPKPNIDTLLPALISAITASATALTAASDCLLSRLALPATDSTSSVLFTATSWRYSGKFPDIQEVSRRQVKHFPCMTRGFERKTQKTPCPTRVLASSAFSSTSPMSDAKWNFI
jgi:hypothetical protein